MPEPYAGVMADRKPPRPQAGGERETLLALLQYQRDSVVRKVDGVSDEQARHRFVDSDTTLLWLVRHLTRAEHIWLVHRFDGVDEVIRDTVQPDDTLAGVDRRLPVGCGARWAPSSMPLRRSTSRAGSRAASRRSTSAGS